MKIIPKFVCECCHGWYNTEEEAMDCEASHMKIEKIVDARYNRGEPFPRRLYVEMEDGRTVRYADPIEVKLTEFGEEQILLKI